MIKEFFSEILVFHSLLVRFYMDSGGGRCLVVASVDN